MLLFKRFLFMAALLVKNIIIGASKMGMRIGMLRILPAMKIAGSANSPSAKAKLKALSLQNNANKPGNITDLSIERAYSFL